MPVGQQGGGLTWLLDRVGLAYHVDDEKFVEGAENSNPTATLGHRASPLPPPGYLPSWNCDPENRDRTKAESTNMMAYKFIVSIVTGVLLLGAIASQAATAAEAKTYDPPAPQSFGSTWS